MVVNLFQPTIIVYPFLECSKTVIYYTGSITSARLSPACELSKTHDQKMLPASKLSYSVVALVMIDTLLDYNSGIKFITYHAVVN
jgi:hypothetical protein